MSSFFAEMTYLARCYRIVPNKCAQCVDKNPGRFRRSWGTFQWFFSQTCSFLTNFCLFWVKFSIPKCWGRVYLSRHVYLALYGKYVWSFNVVYHYHKLITAFSISTRFDCTHWNSNQWILPSLWIVRNILQRSLGTIFTFIFIVFIITKPFTRDY